MEPEKKGLIKVDLNNKKLKNKDTTIIDFERFYYSLDLNKEIVHIENYYTDSYSPEFHERTPYPTAQFYFKADKTNADTLAIERLTNASVNLTEDGTKAYDIIISTIGDLTNNACLIKEDTSKTK